MALVRASRSIRMRLTLWYAVALAAALGIYALVTLGLLWRAQCAELRSNLQHDIEITQNTLELKDGKLLWDTEDTMALVDGPPAVRVSDPSGNLLFETPRYARIKARGHLEQSRQQVVERRAVIISAVRSTQPMLEQLARTGLSFALGIPLLVALAGLGGYLLARRVLRPLQVMAAHAKAIRADQLSERLPIANPDDELGQLAAVFNATFAGLEKSFQELRRFTADASHELRTPLTAIKSVGEVALGTGATKEECRAAIASMLEETDRLARLLDTLLNLSRADAGQVKLNQEAVDLGELSGEVTQVLGVLAEEKSQDLQVQKAPNVFIEADRVVLRQALINILDNAIKYSPEGASIRLRVARENGHAIAEISDNGPGIAPEHAARIYDRFYRVDKARSRADGGAGLGLSIAKWAVEVHGGHIELQAREGGGSCFRIVMPVFSGKAITSRS